MIRIITYFILISYCSFPLIQCSNVLAGELMLERSTSLLCWPIFKLDPRHNSEQKILIVIYKKLRTVQKKEEKGKKDENPKIDGKFSWPKGLDLDPVFLVKHFRSHFLPYFPSIRLCWGHFFFFASSEPRIWARACNF